MTKLCEKYEQIMRDYRSGKFGNEILTIAEIFRKAGEPDLFEKMNEAELGYLRKTGQISGMIYSYALKALKDRQISAKYKATDDLAATANI